MFNYISTNDSTCDATKLAILSILRSEFKLMSKYGDNSKKTVSFDDMVQFNDENIFTYVDFVCGD